MPSDPFDQLGLTPTFDLDPTTIERAYLARVSSLHPDLALGAHGPGSDDPATGAAMLNEARLTLLDPEKRARALLRVLAVNVQGDSLPDGFLMEIMETRMELEAAAASGNSQEIERWQRWAETRRNVYLSQVADAFRQFESSDQAKAMEILTTLNALRYIERMLEQVGLADTNSGG